MKGLETELLHRDFSGMQSRSVTTWEIHGTGEVTSQNFQVSTEK